MSAGRVISKPARKHECAPGWETRTRDDGSTWACPPSSYDYPKGTVWECGCGKRWVSKGAIAPNSPGCTWWRPERWLSHWGRAAEEARVSDERRRSRPSLLAAAATAATLTLGSEAWPRWLRIALTLTAVSLWLMTVIKRV